MYYQSQVPIFQHYLTAFLELQCSVHEWKNAPSLSIYTTWMATGYGKVMCISTYLLHTRWPLFESLQMDSTMMGWWLHLPSSGFTLESAKKVSFEIYENKFRVFSQHHSHKQIFNTSYINLHFFFLQFNWLNFNWIKLDLNSILCIWIQFKVGTQCHLIFSFELNLIFIIWIHYFH
jgi:hypothetical protein